MAHTHSMKKTHPVPHEEVHYFPGLTKREVFAAMAMHAFMVSRYFEPSNPFLFEAAAKAADDQLAELAKKGGA